MTNNVIHFKKLNITSLYIVALNQDGKIYHLVLMDQLIAVSDAIMINIY